MSSARKLTFLALPTCATLRSSRTVILECSSCGLEIGRRGPILMALRQRGGRIGNHLLIQQVHEEEERLGLEYQQDGFSRRIVVEMLVHAAVLHQHDIAGLPFNAPPIVNVVAPALEHE